jgi:hypothetical protein
MRSSTCWLLACGLLLVATTPMAQSIESLPGYFALEQLGVFGDGELEVDIDLRGAMAKIVSAATANEDPQFSAAMEKIQRIRVQVGSVADRDQTVIRATIDGAVKRLEASGWYRTVTVRDEEEAVVVLALEQAGLLRGLTVFVHDGDEEVVLVNIAGDMDPEAIGSLISNVDQLGSLREAIAEGVTEP